MDLKFLNKIENILRMVINTEPNFYRDKFKKAGVNVEMLSGLDEAMFLSLPTLKLDEIALAPYQSRLYKEGTGFNKLIYSESQKRYFLIHRLLEEITQDQLTIDGSRPIVILNNMYEAIERCLFFYEKGILPLIGEVYNPTVVFSMAQQYEADMIYIDHPSVETFRDGLLRASLPLKSITVIDSVFYEEDLNWPQNFKVRLILSVLEAGRIAYSCPGSNLKEGIIFHPYDDIFIEFLNSAVVVTSSRLVACPIIRFDISIKATICDSICGCNKTSFVIPFYS